MSAATPLSAAPANPALPALAIPDRRPVPKPGPALVRRLVVAPVAQSTDTGPAPIPAVRAAHPAPRLAPPVPAAPALAVRTEPAWVVVDLENLAGTGDPGHGLIKSTWESLRRVLVPGDRVVIATGALCASPVKYVLSRTGARFLVRAGKNGAENALIENTDVPEIAKHYRWLVIASGDGRLTGLAAEAVGRGMGVWQVTGVGGCHPSLAMAATVHSRLRITVPGRHGEARSA